MGRNAVVSNDRDVVPKNPYGLEPFPCFFSIATPIPRRKYLCPDAALLHFQTMDTPVPFKSSPFLNSRRPQVFVQHGLGPYENTRIALANLDLSPASGKRVLLKPNVGRMAAEDSGVITNSQVVAAAIDAFREAGAEVAIGESPIVGINTMEAYDQCGLAAMAREKECPLIDMDARLPLEIPIPDGAATHTLKLCADVQDFDILVSIPVMKMHMHTVATLSVKNMKGCLWRRSKVELHMLPPAAGYDTEKSLNVAITDMATILRPHLAIIDGTVGMEGLGPSAGDAKPVDAVVVGADPFAADAVAASIMGLEPADIPHLRIGAARGLGAIDLEQIDISPATWRDAATPFAPVPQNLSIQFPDTNILDKQSCSACQSTLLLFLKRYGNDMFQYLPDGPVQIAIGKGHENLPDNTILIGNCTRAHKENGLFVTGCPPVASAILNKIKDAGSDPSGA